MFFGAQYLSLIYSPFRDRTLGFFSFYRYLPKELDQLFLICISCTPLCLPIIYASTIAVTRKELQKHHISTKKITAITDFAGLSAILANEDCNSRLDATVPISQITAECAELGVDLIMVPNSEMNLNGQFSERLGCVERKFEIMKELRKKYAIGVVGNCSGDAVAVSRADVGVVLKEAPGDVIAVADMMLVVPDFSVLVDCIKISRVCVQRLRAYAVSRMAMVVHFATFFFVNYFLSEKVFHNEIVMPIQLLVIVILLHEVSSLFIPFDKKLKPADQPQHWRFGQFLLLSFVMGLLLAGQSIGVLFIALRYFDLWERKQILSITFLQLSISSGMLIYSTRLETWMWRNSAPWYFYLTTIACQLLPIALVYFGENSIAKLIYADISY
ncbi:hypothetical protein HK098_000337, partial [Nowakowskiella sp. JEL0407]